MRGITTMAGARIPHAPGVVPPHVCTEGPTWVSTALLNVNHSNICAGAGIFVVGESSGSNGRAEWSADGVTWTASNTIATSSIPFQGISYGGSLFFASANAVQMVTSPDGATWTVHSRPSMSSSAGFFGAGKYWMLGTGTSIQSTVNGTSIVTATVPNGLASLSGAEGGGNLVCVSGTGACYSTNGGTTWTASTTPGTWGAVSTGTVRYLAGAFVFVDGRNSNKFHYSTDGGVTWTQGTLPATNSWCCSSVAQGVMLIGGTGTARLCTSTDGINWALTANPSNSFTSATGFSQLAYNDTLGKWLATNIGPSTTLANLGTC